MAVDEKVVGFAAVGGGVDLTFKSRHGNSAATPQRSAKMKMIQGDAAGLFLRENNRGRRLGNSCHWNSLPSIGCCKHVIPAVGDLDCFGIALQGGASSNEVCPEKGPEGICPRDLLSVIYAGHPASALTREHLDSRSDLTKIVQAAGGSRFFGDSTGGGKAKCGEDRDDGHNGQQFDQREGWLFCRRSFHKKAESPAFPFKKAGFPWGVSLSASGAWLGWPLRRPRGSRWRVPEPERR